MRLILLLLSLFITNVYAETCPNAIDVQHNNTKGWQAYDSDTDVKLSDARNQSFRAGAKQFALAEWVNEGKTKGAIHCYYRDKDGSNLESYLAKDNSVPLNLKTAWYEVTGSMQCAKSQKACAFNFESSKTQLAQN